MSVSLESGANRVGATQENQKDTSISEAMLPSSVASGNALQQVDSEFSEAISRDLGSSSQGLSQEPQNPDAKSKTQSPERYEDPGVRAALARFEVFFPNKGQEITGQQLTDLIYEATHDPRGGDPTAKFRDLDNWRRANLGRFSDEAKNAWQKFEDQTLQDSKEGRVSTSTSDYDQVYKSMQESLIAEVREAVNTRKIVPKDQHLYQPPDVSDPDLRAKIEAARGKLQEEFKKNAMALKLTSDFYVSLIENGMAKQGIRAVYELAKRSLDRIPGNRVTDEAKTFLRQVQRETEALLKQGKSHFSDEELQRILKLARSTKK